MTPGRARPTPSSITTSDPGHLPPASARSLAGGIGAGVSEAVDRHGAFPHLDADQQARLRDLGRVRTVESGEVLFAAGQMQLESSLAIGSGRSAGPPGSISRIRAVDENTMIVEARHHARGRSSGIKVSDDLFYEYRLREGRIERITLRQSWRDALEAVGLQE
jgi:hypothetical protein